MKPAGVLMVPRLAPRGLQRGRSKWFLLLLLLGCGVVGSALDRTQSLKTGTTIAGVVCRDSVVLAADTRSTMGAIVADKNCEKIHRIGPYIYCCGAGTAAHAERITAAARTWLKMEKTRSVLSSSEFEDPSLPSRVVAAATGISRVLARRELSAAFVLGGWDESGLSLFQIEPDGTCQKVKFTALGSGSFAAMAVLEARYRPGLSTEQGLALVQDAITSGILNDLGSGSSVDVCVIRRDGSSVAVVDYQRGVRPSRGGRKADGVAAEAVLRREEGGRRVRLSPTRSRRRGLRLIRAEEGGGSSSGASLFGGGGGEWRDVPSTVPLGGGGASISSSKGGLRAASLEEAVVGDVGLPEAVPDDEPLRRRPLHIRAVEWAGQPDEECELL